MRYLHRKEETKSGLEFVSLPDSTCRYFSAYELKQWTELYASYLYRHGIRAGDRIGLYLPNCPELVVALFGNHLLGVVTVPVSPTTPFQEFEYLAGRAELSGIVCVNSSSLPVEFQLLHGDFWESLQSQKISFPESKDMEGPALLCFTSGTTSRPKGVLLTHRNLQSNLHDLIKIWQWSSEDRLLLTLPLFHVHGLVVALHGWAMTGCETVLTSRFDAVSTLDIFKDKRCTLFMGVPTMYQRMVSLFDPSQHSFETLRLAISGSAPMSLELHEKCRLMMGQTILERYGMTETIMNTSNPFNRRKPGSVGLPLPSVQVRLIDEDVKEIQETNRIGEICVRGPNVFEGYWKDPEATRKAFSGDWLRTGDAGFRDSDGYYYVVGRLSVDIIKSGGYRIGSREIEEVLEWHPNIQEVAVVGLPDLDLGEKVVAFVVGNADTSPEDLMKHCQSSLALFKCPRVISFVDSLPRNAMGKVNKAILKSKKISFLTDSSIEK